MVNAHHLAEQVEEFAAQHTGPNEPLGDWYWMLACPGPIQPPTMPW
jgi:hypothetical protein